MTAGSCGFAIEVRCSDGALAGVCDASPACCVEDAWFRGVRTGRLPNGGERPALHIAPTWHATQRPAVTGLTVALGDGPTHPYTREVFRPQAAAFVARLRDAGRLSASEAVVWSVVAREDGPDEPGAAAQRAPFPLEPCELPSAAPGSSAVSFEAATLRGLRDRIRRSGTVEGAELLVGHLLHDAARDALELRVVDAIALEPGRGGRSSTHFSFSPVATVAARRRALERGDGSSPCGWHHNHNPCPGCSHNPDCRVNWVFFSDDDLDVHAMLFTSPHMVALVGGKLGDLPASRPGFRLYGWRDGEIVERAFRVVGEGADDWDAQRSAFRDEPEPAMEAVS